MNVIFFENIDDFDDFVDAIQLGNFLFFSLNFFVFRFD